MEYIVQYSMRTDDRIAVSDWIEKITKIECNGNAYEAKKLFIKKNIDRAGTLLILDVFPNVGNNKLL